MLDSGNEVTAASDGDAPRMPGDLDLATPYDAPVIRDDVDPVIPGDAPVVPDDICLLYTSPSPRDKRQSRMPSSA